MTATPITDKLAKRLEESKLRRAVRAGRNQQLRADLVEIARRLRGERTRVEPRHRDGERATRP